MDINLPDGASWARKQRLLWIAEIVGIFGFVNRKHVARKFEVTEQIATGDLQTLRDMNPNFLVYDVSAKRYERPQAAE